VGEHLFETRHLRTRNTFMDILKDLGVLAAVQKLSSSERWPPPAARVTAVADLAGFVVQFIAGGDCFRIAGQRVLFGWALSLGDQRRAIEAQKHTRNDSHKGNSFSWAGSTGRLY